MTKVFFIGDIALDEYYQTDYFPKLKEKVIVHTMPAQMGGSMANAACVFKKLGNKTEFLTALNSGAITQHLMKGMEEAGIGIEHMVFDDSIPDAKCIIILAENEHTVFIPTLALEKIEIREETLHALEQSDYIYSNFCELRPICCGEMKVTDVLKKIKENGTQLWVDLDCAELSDEETELFRYVDVAFVNEMGESNLKKRYGDRWKEELFKQGVSILVITQAENGCSLYTKDGEEDHIPGVSVEVRDVTGAGDTFGSSFLHAYIRNKDLKRCAEFANYVAARAVTGIGARYGVADTEKVRDFMKEHGGDVERYCEFL